MKLQDAFISETGAYFGSWNTIGYQAPGAASTTATVGQTSNFKYTQEGSYDTEKETASLADNDAASWAAENLLKLNDCTGAKNWQLKPVAENNGQYTWYTKELGAGCLPLTPQFGNLGTSTF